MNIYWPLVVAFPVEYVARSLQRGQYASATWRNCIWALVTVPALPVEKFWQEAMYKCMQSSVKESTFCYNGYSDGDDQIKLKKTVVTLSFLRRYGGIRDKINNKVPLWDMHNGFLRRSCLWRACFGALCNEVCNGLSVCNMCSQLYIQWWLWGPCSKTAFGHLGPVNPKLLLECVPSSK